MNSKKEKLDYLLIPTGWKRQRKKRAIEELKEREIKNIIILNGNNSEEDILYLGKKLKSGEKIGFVTFPLHYEEYKIIIKKAQKDKKFPRRIKIEHIPTNETIKQFLYGIFGLADEIFLEGTPEYAKNKSKNTLIFKIKEFIKWLLK